MGAGRATGFAIGLMMGLVIVVILFKIANSDKKVKTEYDERQQAIRGKAYKYAFYTTCLTLALSMLVSIAEIELPFVDLGLYFFPIMTGSLVLAGYTIWNDGYWGLNNNIKRYVIIFVITVVFNLIPVVGPIASGTLFEADGKIGLPILNIMVVFMLVVLGGIFLAKKIADKASGSGEDA